MKKNSQYTNLSPNQKALRRLLKNRPAVFGLGVIVLAVLIAILGYSITPDATPDANDQVNEINYKAPGFSTKMLKVRKNRNFEEQSIFRTMFYGKPNPYIMVPVTDCSIQEHEVLTQVYQGENIEPEERSYSLADIVYPISSTNPTVNVEGNHLTFLGLNQEPKRIPVAELRQQVEQQHIVQKTYFLGTDGYGRDMLSRLLIGVRISLSVGLIAVLISLTIGIFLGAVAGYFGGKTDNFIMLLINTMWSVPTLLLVFALVLALGRGYWQIFTAVGLTMWVMWRV